MGRACKSSSCLQVLSRKRSCSTSSPLPHQNTLSLLFFCFLFIFQLLFSTLWVECVRDGNGKKDAEPGRCRRTDGKKWRCSKDASPDSKYCERHMHRGKNCSSRKPLSPPYPPQFTVSSRPSIFLDFSLSSSRARNIRTGYMDDFLSIEPSASIKSCSGLAMEEDDGSCRYESLKQREKQPDRSCFILGTDLGTLERPLMLEEKVKHRDYKDYEEEEQQSKRFYKFLDEWPSSKSSGNTSLFI